MKTAQAFRPHVLDNFEPQDYPDDFAYPGGPPVRPYDVTGYTLAYQMGVVFDRVLDAVRRPVREDREACLAARGQRPWRGQGEGLPAEPRRQ